MDPITHTFTGAALAASGLRRTTPLATAALILGANAPDIDGCAYFAGPYAALAFRRGWTHGILVVAVLPFVVIGALLLWDRLWRRRKRPAAAPARAVPLLGVAALAVATHPFLDWLNNYGIRWLMPFAHRWFYGDALFIVDPWVWLTLGAVVCLTYSRRPAAVGAWSAFWLLATLLMLSVPGIGLPARILWLAGVAAVLAARARGFAAPVHAVAIERLTRAAILIVGVYIVAAVSASAIARHRVRDVLAARGIGPIQQVMVAPVLAKPFQGQVVAETATDYYLGHWNWLARPRYRPDGVRISRPSPFFAAAATDPDARRYLTWARFPYVDVESNGASEYAVRFRDARYAETGRLSGPTVRLCATTSGFERCGGSP
jgi:inner membrane protein